MKGNIAAIVLVVLGVFFLLTNLGLISISLRELLRVWWPVALIAVGLALFFTLAVKADKLKKAWTQGHCTQCWP